MKNLAFIIFTFCTSILTAQISDIITNSSRISSMVINGNELYFSSSDNNTISKFDLTEDNIEIIEVVSGIITSSLAINGDYLYFNVIADSNTETMRININEDQSEIETIANFRANNMIFYDNTLYFSYAFWPSDYSVEYNIAKIEINDPTFTKVDLILDVDARYGNIPLAIKDDFLYFSAATKLWRFNITNTQTQPAIIKTLNGHSDCLIFNENNLYSNIDETDEIIKFDTLSPTFEITNIINEVGYSVNSLAFYNDILYIAYRYDYFGYDHRIGLVDTTLSVNRVLSSNEKFIIYPNPTQDNIEILNVKGSKKYKIYDSIGRILKKGAISSNQIIDVKHLISGAYYLKIENEKILRFIKI